jgi:hypothetical protein
VEAIAQAHPLFGPKTSVARKRCTPLICSNLTENFSFKRRNRDSGTAIVVAKSSGKIAEFLLKAIWKERPVTISEKMSLFVKI